MKLTVSRRRMLYVCGLIALAEVILLIRLWPDRPTSSTLKPAPVLAEPQPTALNPSPLYAANTSLCGEGIHTVEAMIDKLGLPEKIYQWRQGGPENLFMNYGYKYLYPRKGVNFIANGPARIYGNAEVIDPNYVPPTVMPMNNLQAAISSECYPPTTFEAYKAQYPGYGETGDSHFGDQYVDWISP